jgi:hypothetical protein
MAPGRRSCQGALEHADKFAWTFVAGWQRATGRVAAALLARARYGERCSGRSRPISRATDRAGTASRSLPAVAGSSARPGR